MAKLEAIAAMKLQTTTMLASVDASLRTLGLQAEVEKCSGDVLSL